MNRKRALKGGQETSRALNRRAVFSLLRAESGLSRADLASRTGLSRAAITGVVNEMIGEGLLREGRPSAGPPGRRPIPLEICYEARQAVGVRVLGRALECVLTDLSTRVLAKTVVPLEDSTPAGLVEAIVTAVVRLGRTEAAVGSRITGVGVGIPGAVQADTGKVLRSFRLGWRNVQLARMLAKRIDLPVCVDDDTHSFALAQHLFGIGQHRGTVAVLAI